MNVMSGERLWAWIRREKPAVPFQFKTIDRASDEAIVGAAAGCIESWFLAGPDRGDGQPIQGDGGIYVQVYNHQQTGEPYASIYVKLRGSSFESVCVYEGPLNSTNEDVIEFWSKMVADRLTGETNDDNCP